jgi:hypothetical protein
MELADLVGWQGLIEYDEAVPSVGLDQVVGDLGEVHPVTVAADAESANVAGNRSTICS